MEDLNLYDGDPIVDDNIDLIWQQVNILFDTYKGQLFGDDTYGTDYESLLYDLKASANDLKRRMESDLDTLNLLGYSYKVEAYLLKGTQRDIALIKVDFYDIDNNVYTKIYKIE